MDSNGEHQNGIIDVNDNYILNPEYNITEFEQLDYYGGKDKGIYLVMSQERDGFFDVVSDSLILSKYSKNYLPKKH